MSFFSLLLNDHHHEKPFWVNFWKTHQQRISTTIKKKGTIKFSADFPPIMGRKTGFWLTSKDFFAVDFFAARFWQTTKQFLFISHYLFLLLWWISCSCCLLAGLKNGIIRYNAAAFEKIVQKSSRKIRDDMPCKLGLNVTVLKRPSLFSTAK